MNTSISSVKEMVAANAAAAASKRDISWIEDLKAAFGESVVLVDDASIDSHSYDTWPVATKMKNQGKRIYAPDVVIEAKTAEKVAAVLEWASSKKSASYSVGGWFKCYRTGTCD